MKSFDVTKPVQTRDGRKARIICTDAKEGQPIIALVDEGSYESIRRYNPCGSWSNGTTSGADLINIPDRITREVWINVYPNEYHVASCVGHLTREGADANAFDDRCACIPVTISCTVGEGLEARGK